MLSLFTIKPTERNMQIARAAQIYYHQGAYAEKPVADDKPEQKKPEQKAEAKAEQKKPVEQKKPEDQKKPEQAEQKKPVEQKKPEQKPEAKAEQKKPVEQKKPEQKEAKAEQKKPVEQKKPEDQKKPEQAEQKKPVEQKKPEDQKKPEQKKPVEQAEQKPAVEPVVEVLDKEGNIVAMLPGVPEEAPKAARTTGAGFDINNFVKPKQSKQQAPENLGQTKSINEVYGFIRSKGVGYPFDPMPGFSVTEKVEVLKKYANFNGTHPGLDVIQLNTLLMIFNSPDLNRKMIGCGLDPKQVLGVKRFNEVPANKYDNNNAYDFAFEYTLSKKKKLVLLVNSIPTYDEKQGWMSGYNISVR